MTEPNQVTMDDDTRYLLPSEIARLVYGYLKQNHCDEVAEKFLNTSPHMKECLEMRNKRCTFMTKAHNLTLEEISNQCLKMNEMLLDAVNKQMNQPKKFRDPVKALKFIIDPTSSKDCPLVTDEPSANLELHFPTCSNVNLSTERVERSDISQLPDLNVWSESTSKELGIFYAPQKRFAAGLEDDLRPARNLHQDAVLNKCGKVKVLRPRHSVPVAGKTITRHSSDEQEPAPSHSLDENPVSAGLENLVPTNLEPPSPESPLREDDNFVDEDPLLENLSETIPSITIRLPTPPAKAAEEASTAGSRSRRKKSSGSWNGEQTSLSKSSCSKIVPEIEKGHMLIQQTLKNPNFYERIAENINKAISESPQKKMVIAKKAADETMNDPMCQDIINELLGCLTSVTLENHADDVDNLSFADKFYENAASDSNFQTGEPVGPSVPISDANTNYQSLHNFVSIDTQQRESEIIFVGNVADGSQNQSTNQNYCVENQENAISNSNVDIRSYFTSTPDIKESCDNVETINGTVINVLESNLTNLIPVHNMETGKQYCIASSVPMFVEGAATSITTVAPVAVDSRKRSARIQPCVFPTARISRRLMPIAPKPSVAADGQNQPAPLAKDKKIRRPTKRMKK